MKIRIMFKDPDGVYEAIRDRAADDISDKLARWIRFGEYMTVEFDTEAGTATVVPA